MLRKTIFLLVIPAIIILITFWLLGPVKPNNKDKQSLTIEKGERVSRIADKLKEKNLIKSPLAFKIFVKLKGVSSRLQAGIYALSSSQTMGEIIDSLASGKTEDIKITIIEGLRREEIADYLGSMLDKNVENEFLNQTVNLEGKLFPDTYFIKKNTPLSEIIKKMTANFNQKFDQATENPKVSDLTKDQILILASIVEREAKYDKDRPLVAGILYKRFENGWPLEADATVQYAIGFIPFENSWWKKSLTPEDLDIDSPYNTRKNIGLPPKPISNPSLASLLAATRPENSSYWFYISDKSGNMHYAMTLEEHQQNINKFLDK